MSNYEDVKKESSFAEGDGTEHQKIDLPNRLSGTESLYVTRVAYDALRAEKNFYLEAIQALRAEKEYQTKHLNAYCDELKNEIIHLKMQLAIKEEQLDLKVQTIEYLNTRIRGLEVAYAKLFNRRQEQREVTKEFSFPARIWQNLLAFFRPDYV